MLKSFLFKLSRKAHVNQIPIWNILNITFLNILARGLGMFGAIWMARSLEPTQLGIVAFVVTCQNPLLRVLTLGLDPILVRITSGLAESDTLAIFRAYLNVKLRLAIGLLTAWTIAFTALWYLRGSELSCVALLLGPLFVTSSFSSLGMAQRLGKMRQSAIWDAISAFTLSAFTLLLLKKGDDAVSAAVIMGVSGVVGGVAMLAWIRSLLGRGNKIGDESIFRSHVNISQGLWPLVTSLASFGYTTLEIPLVGALYGFDAAGYYRVGATLPSALYILVYTFANVMYPSYVEWAQSPTVLKQRLRQLSSISMTVLVLGVAFVIFAGKPLLQSLFGSIYVKSYTILVLLWTAKLVVVWVNVWTMSLLALKQERFVAKTALAVSCVCLAANYVSSFTRAGAPMVALLSLVSELGVGLLCWWRVRTYFRNLS